MIVEIRDCPRFCGELCADSLNYVANEDIKGTSRAAGRHLFSRWLCRRGLDGDWKLCLECGRNWRWDFDAKLPSDLDFGLVSDPHF